MNINLRIRELEELEIFMKEKKEILLDVLNKIGWTEESFESELKTPCPINPDHWINESSLKQHVEKCSIAKHSNDTEEKVKDHGSSNFFYENATSVVSVYVDKNLQDKILSENNLLPEKSPNETSKEQNASELTPQQRLAIYDYVVKEGKSGTKPKDLTVEDLVFDFEKKNEAVDRPKSYLEMLAEQRDYKRRRQSYRAKNVHITKKSYTEVMKEVIENQITYLAESQKEEDSEKLKVDTLSKDKNKLMENETYKNEESLQRSSNDYESNKHWSHKEESHSSSTSRHKHKRSHSKSRVHHKHKKSHHKKHKREKQCE